MGADEKRARFARIREQIQQTATALGQATLATGVLILCAPGGEVTPSTAAEQIQVVDYHAAAPADRVSDATQVAAADPMPVADFGNTFQDFKDESFGKA